MIQRTYDGSVDDAFISSNVCTLCEPRLAEMREVASRRVKMRHRKQWLIDMGVAYKDELALKASHRRRFSMECAIPHWADRDAIKAVYEQCRQMSKRTGVPHHVDHIVPIQGRNVCGLHVPWNLRIIPSAENRSKGNKLLDGVA